MKPVNIGSHLGSCRGTPLTHLELSCVPELRVVIRHTLHTCDSGTPGRAVVSVPSIFRPQTAGPNLVFDPSHDPGHGGLEPSVLRDVLGFSD